jgi:membrane protein implicated in regulation of membrane protease activity
MSVDPRHIVIAVVSLAAIMVGGALVFGASNEVAMQAVAMVGVVVFFAVFHLFDERRRKRERTQ